MQRPRWVIPKVWSSKMSERMLWQSPCLLHANLRTAYGPPHRPYSASFGTPWWRTMSPNGVRRGGAICFFLATASMDATLHRGRWTCNRTARMYVDQGTLAMAKFMWSTNQRHHVRKWTLKGARLIERLRQVKSRGKWKFSRVLGWSFVSIFSAALGK